MSEIRLEKNDAIAAIEDVCIGGGLGIARACDVRTRDYREGVQAFLNKCKPFFPSK